MGLPTELFNLTSSFDPYGAFVKAGMETQKYGIQQAMLDEQTKEIEAEKQAGLAQQTGQIGQPAPLAKMTNQMIPDAKLYNDDGTMTVAGQMNDMMLGAVKNAKQAKMMSMQATLIEDPYQRNHAMGEARRYAKLADEDKKSAREMNDKVKNDSLYAASMAKDQTQWDAAIQAYQDSGLPLPKGIPTDYSPENAKKIAALAPAALQSKINNDIIKRDREVDEDKLRKLNIQRITAKLLSGDGEGGAATSKTYETLEEKVNDPKYGVAKGKVPSKEQTVARRITTDSKEVTQGIDQIMTLTEGGMRDTTGTTFANVKDTGLLTAPVKFFTNKISDKDSAMYDAMMYPLVKGLSLYTNPDYRPTDNDVKIAMNAYKAQAGQPQEVQLEKLAELKKNYLSAAESFLDSSILNAQQANSLKQQIRYVEKAIPWEVKDVVGFSRQSDYKKFEDYLSSRKDSAKPKGAGTKEDPIKL